MPTSTSNPSWNLTLQQVAVHLHIGHLVPERHRALLLVAEHVAVDSRQLMNILARLPVPSVQHEGVQNVQRIEEEMRVDLLLEVEVLELGEVGAILFSFSALRRAVMAYSIM